LECDLPAAVLDVADAVLALLPVEEPPSELMTSTSATATTTTPPTISAVMRAGECEDVRDAPAADVRADPADGRREPDATALGLLTAAAAARAGGAPAAGRTADRESARVAAPAAVGAGGRRGGAVAEAGGRGGLGERGDMLAAAAAAVAGAGRRSCDAPAGTASGASRAGGKVAGDVAGTGWGELSGEGLLAGEEAPPVVATRGGVACVTPATDAGLPSGAGGAGREAGLGCPAGLG
jgi:hypothetical protein